MGHDCGRHERELLKTLLEGYDALERPVAVETEALNVSFGLTLQQIIDVDEKNQIMTTNAWLNLQWKDYNLIWDPAKYGGVKDLRITPRTIWVPDILMYNSADEKFDGTFHTNVVVRNTGMTLFVPPGIFKSTCKIDITWFPFDDQSCTMKFGSWTYDGSQLNLTLKEDKAEDLSSFISNGEWHLLGMPSKRNVLKYACCDEEYIDITFTVMIRRRTLYYFFNLIVPCVLISSMALLGFTLPPDSGEKLTLGVTILLSLTVFLNLVAESMPTTSDAVPLIGSYFNCIMFMVACSVILTVVVLNYHHRTSNFYHMPEISRRIFLQWMPWLMRMQRPGRELTLRTIAINQRMRRLDRQEMTSRSLMANVLDMEDDFRSMDTCLTATTAANSSRHTPVAATPSDQQATAGTPLMSPSNKDALLLILKELREITGKIRRDEAEQQIISDWKYAAIVIDRFCLYVFTLFTVIVTVVVLLSAPHIFIQ